MLGRISTMCKSSQVSRWILLVSLCAAVALRSPAARAQDPAHPPAAAPDTQSVPQSVSSDEINAVPNRPTFSTTAESVQAGVLEVEYGFELADGHQNLNGLVKFGATEKLELRFLHNPLERDDGVGGMGDSGAGFKYRVMEEKGWRPTISGLYTLMIPTATRDELGLGATGHSVGALLSRDFGKHHLDWNESAQWLGRPGGSGFDRNYFSALAYSHPVRGKWSMTAEVAGFSRANAGTPATLTVLGAAAYSASSRRVFDMGVYVAAYGNLPRTTFFAGVTYSIADLYHHRGKHASATQAAPSVPGSSKN